jgi:hypothetical protein
MKNNNSNNSSNVVSVVSYKSYVEFTVYLNSKFSINYSLSSLENKVKKGLVLYSVILKYGHSNFSLYIL